ncbi:MAG: hypothetical protein ACK5V3_11960 [Bdellovibrionales bacterium]
MAGRRVRLNSILYDLATFLEVAPADKKAQKPIRIRKDCLFRVATPIPKNQKATAHNGSVALNVIAKKRSGFSL